MNFREKFLQNKCSIEAIHDYIDKWHESDSDVELHEFLGLTFDEYAVWVKKEDEALAKLLRNKEKTS